MQQHCVYWDADGDGVIWPQDTYAGVRAWGWSIVLSLLATLIIHAGLSYPTQRSWLLPDPLFRIYIARVHRAKHGSDSLTYDNQGRFRPLAFEEFFANYDKGDKGGLSLWDLVSAGVGQVSFVVLGGEGGHFFFSPSLLFFLSMFFFFPNNARKN